MDLTFTAIGTGRKINFSQLDLPTFILLVDQHSYQAAIDFNPGIRQLIPEADKLMIINVIDLSTVPRLFHRLAKKYLRTAFNTATAALPPGFDPWDYVLILPDWNGSVQSAINLDHKPTESVLIAMDSNGKVFSKQTSAVPLQAAKKILIDLDLIAG